MAGKNICQCPNPPGGVARCEPHQLAVCRVENGHSVTDCISIPAATGLRYAYRNPKAAPLMRQRQLQTWAYRAITGVKPAGGKLSDRQMSLLRSGVFRNEKNGEVVMFSLPETVKKSLGIRQVAEVEDKEEEAES